jgi:hypothetical protein
MELELLANIELDLSVLLLAKSYFLTPSVSVRPPNCLFTDDFSAVSFLCTALSSPRFFIPVTSTCFSWLGLFDPSNKGKPFEF